MKAEEFVASDAWMRTLLEKHRAAVRERDLLVHTDFDPRLQIRASPDLEGAIDGLLDFVLATVPDGCEIFVASTRTTAPVAQLGSGMLTLRWQVTGAAPLRREDNIRPIRPITGGAAAHVDSKSARRVVDLFEGLAARLEIAAAEGDRELWAHVTLAP